MSDDGIDDICEVLSPVSESRGLAVSYLLLQLLEAPELQSRATENAEIMFLVSTLIYDDSSRIHPPTNYKKKEETRSQPKRKKRRRNLEVTGHLPVAQVELSTHLTHVPKTVIVAFFDFWTDFIATVTPKLFCWIILPSWWGEVPPALKLQGRALHHLRHHLSNRRCHLRGRIQVASRCQVVCGADPQWWSGQPPATRPSS